MPAFLSYAFFFRQKESVKRRTTKTSLHIPRPRKRDLIYLIQTTVFARLKNQSVAEVRFRDNFSVTSILIVIANSSVTENSSREKFDSRLFSSQQPLHRLSAVPLPLHGAGKRAYRFYMYYQLNSIIFCLFGCGFALPTPYTGEAYTRGNCTLHHQFVFKLNLRYNSTLKKSTNHPSNHPSQGIRLFDINKIPS